MGMLGNKLEREVQQCERDTEIYLKDFLPWSHYNELYEVMAG
jgi:hypothetical protein